MDLSFIGWFSGYFDIMNSMLKLYVEVNLKERMFSSFFMALIAKFLCFLYSSSDLLSTFYYEKYIRIVS